MARTIDEINNIRHEESDIDIETYFDPMPITEEQKEERKEAAEDLWWVLLLLFALIRESIDSGDLDYAFIYDTFRDSYADVVSKYADADEYIELYINKFTRDTLDTTWENIDLSQSDSFWTSNRRAIGIAVNQANVILNYEDLLRAIREGKNCKVWHTQRDNKVRKEHAVLEGKKVGILDFFNVGESLLQFACDELHCTNARDIANCRCYCRAEYDPKYRTVTEEELQDVMVTNVQS